MNIGAQIIGAEMADDVIRRPTVVRWLWYAFGGGLPEANRAWVLRDLTAPGWRMRQLFRSLVQLAPVAVAIPLFLPGELWIQLMAIGGGGLMGLFYALAYLEEATEHRALKAGYPRGLLKQLRDEAGADERAEAERIYRERYRPDSRG